MSLNTLTYDQPHPRRPGIDDVGGGAKENEIARPDPVRHLTAEDVNQLSKQVVAEGKVGVLARISVTQTAGAYPATPLMQSCRPSEVTNETFTVTKNGVGDVSVTWPAGTFPTPVARPRAHVVGDTPLLITAKPITNGARVRMQNAAGTPTDSDFELDVL